MAKACELAERKQVAIKHLSLTRFSYVEIGRQIGYGKSATFKGVKKFELASSVEK